MKRRNTGWGLVLLWVASTALAQPAEEPKNLTLRFFPPTCVVHCPALSIDSREFTGEVQWQAKPGSYDVEFRKGETSLVHEVEIAPGKRVTLYADFDAEVVFNLSHIYGQETRPTRPAKYDQPPKVLGGQKPHYPQRAKDFEIEGSVVVQVYVTAEGKVDEVKLVTGVHPLLDMPALDAARVTRFRPARLEGKAVGAYVWLPFEFDSTEP